MVFDCYSHQCECFEHHILAVNHNAGCSTVAVVDEVAAPMYDNHYPHSAVQNSGNMNHRCHLDLSSYHFPVDHQSCIDYEVDSHSLAEQTADTTHHNSAGCRMNVIGSLVAVYIVLDPVDHMTADGCTGHGDCMAVYGYMVVLVVALSLAEHIDPVGYMAVPGAVGHSGTGHNAVLVLQGHTISLGLGGHTCDLGRTVPAQAGPVTVLDYRHGHNVPDFAVLVFDSTLCFVQSHHNLEKHPSSDSDHS